MNDRVPTETRIAPDAVRRRAAGRPARDPARTNTARLVGINVILALLIGCVAGLGWFIVEQRELLHQSEVALADAMSKISDLESRLEATDVNFKNSGTSFQEQIDLWESEIRKLWDVSNKRNKAWIEANQRQIAQQSKTAATQAATLKTLAVSVNEHSQALGARGELSAKLQRMDTALEQLLSARGVDVRRLQDQADEINALRLEVGGLGADLRDRVLETERAIEAFDQYRLQVNRRLEQLSGPGP